MRDTSYVTSSIKSPWQAVSVLDFLYFLTQHFLLLCPPYLWQLPFLFSIVGIFIFILYSLFHSIHANKFPNGVGRGNKRAYLGKWGHKFSIYWIFIKVHPIKGVMRRKSWGSFGTSVIVLVMNTTKSFKHFCICIEIIIPENSHVCQTNDRK